MDKIINLLTTNKKFRNAIFLLILILLSIYLINKQLEKARLKKASKDAQRVVIASNLTKADTFYKSLALRLKNAFEGYVFVGWRDTERVEALNALNALNDDEFTQVYVYFGSPKLEGLTVSKNETLRGWINSEVIPFSFADNNAIERMDDLGLI